jgi:hypothetical protein
MKYKVGGLDVILQWTADDNVKTWRTRGSTVIILNTMGRRQWIYFVVCGLRILDPVDWHNKCLYEERNFRCCLNDSRVV